MRGEADRQRWKIELIASENYTFAAVMEAQGSWLTNKYAEGLPGPPLLRRLRVRRRGGASGPGPCARALPGRRARQRPAPRGGAGEPRRLLRGALAGRPDPRHEPCPRRPPDPRLAGQHQREVVRGPCLRRRSRDEPDRLRRARAPGRRGAPEARHRRRQRLLADPRLRALRRDRPRRRAPTSSSTWRTSPGSWPPASTRPRSRTRTSSRRRPTRRSAVRAAASSSRRRSSPSRSTRRSSPARRAGRSCT